MGLLRKLVPARGRPARGSPEKCGLVVLGSVLFHGALVAAVFATTLPGAIGRGPKSEARPRIRATFAQIVPSPLSLRSLPERGLPRLPVEQATAEPSLREHAPREPRPDFLRPVASRRDLLPLSAPPDCPVFPASRSTRDSESRGSDRHPAASTARGPTRATSAVADSGYSRAVHVFAPKPRYPRAARRAGLQGFVVLLLSVTRDGTVASVGLERSSGYEVLDRAARRAAARWRFHAATLAGRPVACRIRVRFEFQLSD